MNSPLYGLPRGQFEMAPGCDIQNRRNSMKTPVTVYVSGKMSARDARGWWRNIRHGEDVAFELMNEGFVVFSPHLGAHFERCDGYDEWDWARWLAYDEDVIRTVDIVYMMDNYLDSQGALRELKFANRIGVPIAYSMDELRAIARDLRRERRVVSA